MSDKKISQLIPAATLVGTEIIPVVQDGVTVKTTAQDIADLAPVVPYKIYSAILMQSGTSDPTATVLENTLGGEIVWTRDQMGMYSGTPEIKLHDFYKIFVQFNPIRGPINSNYWAEISNTLTFSGGNGYIFSITTQYFSNYNSITKVDSILSAYIEIKVYN